MLPRSRWSIIKDKIINVPINDSAISQTVNSFPRLPSAASVIPVQLKRRKLYKGSHVEQYIRPAHLVSALNALQKLGNKHYQTIEIRENYEDFCKLNDSERYQYLISNSTDGDKHRENDENDENLVDIDKIMDPSIVQDLNEVGNDEVSLFCDDDIDFSINRNKVDSIDNTASASHAMEHMDELEKGNEEYVANDPVRKWQYGQDNDVFFDNMYPEMQVDVNGRALIPVAPGEGQIPTNILREEEWDVKTFPHLFPDGKYGLNYPRDVRLTPLNYYIDGRFSSSPGFIYASMAFLENQQLQRNMNMSYTRGRAQVSNGIIKMPLDDGFIVLDKIKNSPKYHQQSKYELIAKLENLGPFQFFFYFVLC